MVLLQQLPAKLPSPSVRSVIRLGIHIHASICIYDCYECQGTFSMVLLLLFSLDSYEYAVTRHLCFIEEHPLLLWL